MNFRCLFCAVCGFAALVCRAPGWNAEGHMVAAQLAYNHLEPAVKSTCNNLISVPLNYGSSANNTFVTAACWADDYKSSLGSGTWHYIDLPFSLDGTSTNGFVPEEFDIVQALDQCIATLRQDAASLTEQAMSLRYVLHLVGDIQQPLHCSTAMFDGDTGGDAGGNGFSIDGTWRNLHSLWDAGGGYLGDTVYRPLTATGRSILNAKVAEIESDYGYVPNPGTIPDPMIWAREGLDLAQTVCYVGIAQGASPSPAYLNSARASTEACMARAGHRLADLLNTLFAPKPVSLSCLTPTNGNYGFSWNALPGRTYHVQWTQDLTAPDWHDLADVTAASNSAAFSETPDQIQRFYRVVQ